MQRAEAQALTQAQAEQYKAAQAAAVRAQMAEEEKRYLFVTRAKMEEARRAMRQSQKQKKVRILPTNPSARTA